jgi:hypothetical protein
MTIGQKRRDQDRSVEEQYEWEVPRLETSRSLRNASIVSFTVSAEIG